MLSFLRGRLSEVVRAVAPIVIVVSVLQVLLVGASAMLFLRFLAGSLLAILGMLLLFTGIDVGILPMGRFIGADLPRRGSLALILGVGFALGFAVTVAEPDVLVLALQVEQASQGGLRSQGLIYPIAFGVGLFVALGLLRVVFGFSMSLLLTVVYGLIVLLSLVTPERFIPLAYDAGSVTTGVLTAPVVLAVALGVSSVLAQREAVSDGFGLLGMASAGPILVLLLAGLLVL